MSGALSVPSGAPRESLSPWLVRLLKAVCAPGLAASASVLKASSVGHGCHVASPASRPQRTVLCLPRASASAVKASLGFPRPAGRIQDHLPISSAAAQSYLQSPFRQARSLWWVPEMRMRTSFGSRALFGRPQAPRSTRRAPACPSPHPPPWKPPRGRPDRRLCICTPFRPFTQTPLRLFRPDAPNTA